MKKLLIITMLLFTTMSVKAASPLSELVRCVFVLPFEVVIQASIGISEGCVGLWDDAFCSKPACTCQPNNPVPAGCCKVHGNPCGGNSATFDHNTSYTVKINGNGNYVSQNFRTVISEDQDRVIYVNQQKPATQPVVINQTTPVVYPSYAPVVPTSWYRPYWGGYYGRWWW